MPCKYTIAMMAYELGVISDLQVGEVMYLQDNTFSWDSTSVDGQHINEIHISIPNDPPISYVLQLGLQEGQLKIIVYISWIALMMWLRRMQITKI